jgi:hypothetical protein
MADLIERRGMVRAVKYVEKDGGLWSMTCDECPLLPHSEALGQDAPRCASGIATRMQGPVPLQTCHNLAPDSYANTTDGGITITCKYGDAAIDQARGKGVE